MNATDIKMNTLVEKTKKIAERAEKMRDLVLVGRISIVQMERDLNIEIKNFKAMLNESDEDFWIKNSNPKDIGKNSIVVSRKLFHPFCKNVSN